MSGDIEWENLEQVARALGERWAWRLHGAPTTPHEAPLCTLERARSLLDEMLGARVSVEQRETLAAVVERSARAALRRFRR